ncbi:copper resistance protein CopC [Agromyces mediolanus]|uniref:copper resistance CopC family protein n=1 Tax=Agromyces mediolanus TaxID=41986 RepID=UPI00203DF7DF|nr:copper resistance CopC family protein [Agromyces mediolanus]MCM3657237.1 copper resistance protein CopC [Agromyces mediolanus]
MHRTATTTAPAISPRRLLALGVIALAAGAWLGLANAQSASAHDELIASSPEPGQVLDASPAEVKLTFSDDIIPVGTAIEVVDHHGEVIDSGEAVVAGPDVTATLPADLSGDYQVRWRAVSSDGHVIDGTIDFGVGPDATGAWTEEAPHDTAASDGLDDTAAEGQDEASAGPDGWAVAGIAGGLVGVAALVAALVVFARARRRDPNA